MPLVTLKEVLKGTRENGYAVGAFNFNSYEDAQGIINGAVAKKAPVIVMASMGAVKYIGLKTTAYMIKGMAESVDIPVCLHLDHATDHDMIKACINAGFTSVMIDASMKSYEENIAETSSVVEYASKFGCSVEAELGKVGGKEDNVDTDEPEAAFTDPADVPRFVRETGLDALAIAIGTVHGFYKSEPKLDFEKLAAIAKVTDVPLVLHGGTGVPVEDFKKAIKLGMSKINVGTELKATYAKAVRESLAAKPNEIDPRKFMGAVKDRCSEVVQEKIDIFGCANRG
ncbi:MAG: class II fructose-1,6-bisphosphate aldolase [Burkholderiales bacterium]